MERMKEKRAEFDRVPAEQKKEYCFTECRCLAELAEQNDQAHTAAGIPLRRYDGTGSSASVILRSLSIDKLKEDPPERLRAAVAAAFIGGRFEHSVIGAVEGPIHVWDLSGAYNYQMYHLPCLQHASWVHTRQRGDIERARHALVRYSLEDSGRRLAWGPFPFREPNGTIVFPSRSGGGWLWRDEFLAGERLYENVKFHEAWLLQSECDCHPFKGMADYYLRRIAMGANTKGLVLKGALAACAGKLMQTKGFMPPFLCYAWAGMTTSGTRAQVLDVIGLHRDPWNARASAADSMHSSEDLPMPAPRDTGTFVTLDGKPNPKPMGGWVKKTIPKGMFYAKPGVYFPLNPTKRELEDVRARGLGRAVVWQNWERVMNAWLEGRRAVELPAVARFHGAKSSISRVGKNRFVRSPDYGEWSERPIGVTLGAYPKRLRHLPVPGTAHSIMTLRAFPSELRSTPYNPALKSPEAELMRLARLEMEEQPEGDDFADYSEEYGE
jgi:hypothetical protein